LDEPEVINVMEHRGLNFNSMLTTFFMEKKGRTFELFIFLSIECEPIWTFVRKAIK